MSDEVGFLDYQESLSIKVGSFLLAKGFSLASSTGIAEHELVEDDSLGILFKDPDTKPRTHLFGLIKRKPRRVFLGTVWFSNDARSASEQNWVFEVFGRKYVELVKQLAEEMALTFNIKIALRLVREQPEVETYRSDYSGDI